MHSHFVDIGERLELTLDGGKAVGMCVCRFDVDLKLCAQRIDPEKADKVFAGVAFPTFGGLGSGNVARTREATCVFEHLVELLELSGISVCR